MVLEFGVGILILDLFTVFLSLWSYFSAQGLPASLESAGGLPLLVRRLEDGACFPRASTLLDSTGAWRFRLHPPPLSAPTPGGSDRFRCSLLQRGRPWAARGSHAPPRRAPTLPPPVLLLLFLCLFVCYIGLICCTPLPLFTPVLVFGSL
jgi:hypothetical protein